MKRVLSIAVMMLLFIAVLPAAAQENGVNFNDSPAQFNAFNDATDSLHLFETITVQGDYVSEGVGLRNLQPRSIPITGVPATATVTNAYLYWNLLAPAPDGALATLNGTQVAGTFLGDAEQTCWESTYRSYAYRADVTSLVSGNGNYAVEILTGVDVLRQGASLVVVYEDASATPRDVVIYDGIVSLTNFGTSSSVDIALPETSLNTNAKTTYVVADGQLPDRVLFNGNIVDTSAFIGLDFELWDTATYDISAWVNAGDTTANASITTNGDCISHLVQVLSVDSEGGADTTPPVVTVPAGLTVEATSPEGAIVIYQTSATDETELDTFVCTPAVATVFPLGATTVNCTATDVAGNVTTASFVVTVVDTTAPVVTVPADIIAPAVSAFGTPIDFVATATDAVTPNPAVTCDPVSGSSFDLGSTTVTCSATDDAGNTGSASFDVTIFVTGGMIEILIADVESLDLQRGVENSLNRRLDASIRLRDDGNPDNTDGICDQLAAFIEVTAEREADGSLTAAEADALAAFAAAIAEGFGC